MIDSKSLSHRAFLLLWLFLGSISSIGAGCDDAPSLRVLSPAEGTAVTWMPLDVAVDIVTTAELETFRVELNGVDVTAHFTLDPPQDDRVLAHAEDLWAPGLLLRDAANTLRAEVWLNETARTRVEVSFDAVGDPYADGVVSFMPGSGAGFGQEFLPDVVLGPPKGDLLFPLNDVVTLGVKASEILLGRIELAFLDNRIVDGPGVDFTVFENAFFVLDLFDVTGVFAEPGQVSVSEDGDNWCKFPCAFGSPPFFPGCAGVTPVQAQGDQDPTRPHPSIPTLTSPEDFIGLEIFDVVMEGAGGDSFDLADCGMTSARFVRIDSAEFPPDVVGPESQGFDLDAVSAIHSAPLP